MNEKYIATVWNARSESHYTFGPFDGEAELDAWIEKLPDNITVTSEDVMNAPDLVGTGQELG